MERIKEKKGQLKIQEMAFVLIAFAVFFSLVAVIYLKLRLSQVEKSADELKEGAASSLLSNIAAFPELGWKGCKGCIDLDKAIIMKELEKRNKSIGRSWKLDYLEIKILYPLKDSRECVLGIYPECGSILLLNKSKNYGIAKDAYVNACYWNNEMGSEKCVLAKIIASGEGIK